jgi:ethanolamine-phosphate cytidylyltransferase
MLPWISHYGCHYVVHGDDITSDSSGDDCYRFVKAAGRFLVVKRTPGISTTDLVGRMLLCTKGHFIKSVKDTLSGSEGAGSPDERKEFGADLLRRINDYAADETGLQPGPEVWTWSGSDSAKTDKHVEEAGTFEKLVPGKAPRPGQRVVYVDGGFDLFSSGHIAFLQRVSSLEESEGRQRGWYEPSEREKRVTEYGEDFGPAYIIAGIHDDAVINHWKGLNYPIMNIFERGLCVLQCKVRSCPRNGLLRFLT